MSKIEQLKYCNVCKYKKFDFYHNEICRLTDQPADFEGKCNSFERKPELMDSNEILPNNSEFIGTIAGKGKRFANYLIDVFFQTIFIISSLYIITIFAPSLSSTLNNDNLFLQYLINFVFSMIYYAAFEASTGKSIGKYFTKTKVVDLNGNKPDFNTILIRSLCRFIPFDAFSFFGSDNSGWHDTVSKTRVVED